MPLTLISATPSAYARINAIALLEKGIPFDLQNEIPWHADTKTPQYNPLEKLPVLILEDGSAVYESAHIQEYIIQKYSTHPPALIPPNDIDAGLQARQLQVLAEGQMDALRELFFDKQRASPSPEWQARQNRKIDGALRAYASLVAAANGGWLVKDVFTIADIAIACGIRWIEFFEARPTWKEEYPELAKWWESVEDRESFKKTAPVMFDLKEKIV